VTATKNLGHLSVIDHLAPARRRLRVDLLVNSNSSLYVIRLRGGGLSRAVGETRGPDRRDPGAVSRRI